MILDSKLWAMTTLSDIADCEWIKLKSYLKQNDKNVNPILIENFFQHFVAVNT